MRIIYNCNGNVKQLIRIELDPCTNEGESVPALARTLIQERLIDVPYLRIKDGYPVFDITYLGLNEEDIIQKATEAQNKLSNVLTEHIKLMRAINILHTEKRLAISQDIKQQAMDHIKLQEEITTLKEEIARLKEEMKELQNNIIKSRIEGSK